MKKRKIIPTKPARAYVMDEPENDVNRNEDEREAADWDDYDDAPEWDVDDSKALRPRNKQELLEAQNQVDGRFYDRLDFGEVTGPADVADYLTDTEEGPGAPFTHPKAPADLGGFWSPDGRRVGVRTDKPEDLADLAGLVSEISGMDAEGFGLDSLPDEVPDQSDRRTKELVLAVWAKHREAKPEAIVAAISAAKAKLRNESNQEPLRALAKRAGVRYQILLKLRKTALSEAERLGLDGGNL